MSECSKTPEVRPLAPDETREAARLHGRELPHEFLTRLGESFLSEYYRAFVESPHAVAFAVSRSGGLRGVLIATFDTRAHYAYLVRRFGASLAWRLAGQALRHPTLARDLLQTRLLRYGRGVLRGLASPSRPRRKPTEPTAERVGFLAYVAVAAGSRGLGVGGALIAAYEKSAWEAGLDRLELVTVPDERGAGGFYERLGWMRAGERVSRSGERYVLYIRYPEL